MPFKDKARFSFSFSGCCSCDVQPICNLHSQFWLQNWQHPLLSTVQKQNSALLLISLLHSIICKKPANSGFILNAPFKGYSMVWSVIGCIGSLAISHIHSCGRNARLVTERQILLAFQGNQKRTKIFAFNKLENQTGAGVKVIRERLAFIPGSRPWYFTQAAILSSSE